MQKNILAEKISKLADIFPECITEKRDDNGNIFRAVNFDLLKNILEENIPDAPEFYDFAWVGKNLARATAYAPTNKTLRPVFADSSNFNTTQNLYIEGDNLDVLKILQRSYFAKVKLIYIDPPYNTGHDFIYNDNFQMSQEDFAAETDMFDEAGNKNFRENKESNPRLHSDWCSMIFARLLVARNLLADDGVIFISIDDNEQANLKKICDEVFGERNFQAMITYVRKTSGKQDSRNFVKSTEYILVYSKNDSWQVNEIIAEENVTSRYNKTDADGRKYRETDLRKTGTNDRREDRPNMFYPFYFDETKNILSVEKIENAVEIYPMKTDGTEGCWRWQKETAAKNIDRLVARIMPKYKTEKKYTVYEKDFMDKRGEVVTVKEHTFWNRTEFNSDKTAQEFKDLGFGNNFFPFPKNSEMIKKILELATDKNSIVLDFFSGSATTAHAVMELNAEDGGRRQFIMVQLPEMCREDSEAAKAGYSNICEIGKERIRRAGQKIKESAPLVTQELDTGFRVLKLDSTNYRNVFIEPKNLTQEMLEDAEENIKKDRSAADLLFGVLIEIGAELNKSYGAEEFSGATIHNYNGGEILACFDKNISLEVVKHIAQKKPEKIFFRDASFATDSDRMNAMAILEYYKLKSKTKII